MIRFENWEDTPKADDSVAALAAEMAQRLPQKGTDRMTPEERIEVIAQQLPGLCGSQRRVILDHLRAAACSDGERQPESSGPFGDHPPPESGVQMESMARTPSARDLIERRVDALLTEADGLKAILESLPVKLPRPADVALARLIRK